MIFFWFVLSSLFDMFILCCVVYIIKFGIVVIYRDFDKRSFFWDIDIVFSVLLFIFISMLIIDVLWVKWVCLIMFV